MVCWAGKSNFCIYITLALLASGQAFGSVVDAEHALGAFFLTQNENEFVGEGKLDVGVPQRGHLYLRQQLSTFNFEKVEAVRGRGGKKESGVFRHVNALASNADRENSESSAVASVVHHHVRIV